MKALYLMFHGFDESSGITKKVRYQIKALRACGLDVRTCYYEVTQDGHRQWKADHEVLVDFGQGTLAKMKKRFRFDAIVRYVAREDIRFVYIRSFHNANPFTIHLVNQLRKRGAKVVMEIPTYPYDQEYNTRRMKLDLAIDKCFRHRLCKAVDRIVTFSNADTIFGGRTIRISNGIDFDAIPLKTRTNDTTHELHLIGVAEIHYWHAFDRLIRGLAEYYRTNPTYKVYFDIVGQLTGEREREDILPAISHNHLEPYVKMHGNRHGHELDELFEQADFAIGSLGRHRSNITYIKTLKNREYAARGIPFIYSETDGDFEEMPYVLKAPANESPIDIPQLIRFCQSKQWVGQDIRNSVKSLAWEAQMQRVIDEEGLRQNHL